MPTVLLIRHGRTTANAQGLLAGRAPGVHLDATGRVQARALAGDLAGLGLRRAVTSPLDRCRETTREALAGAPRTPVLVDERLTECGYGDWTGRALADLALDPLWPVVQHTPSAVTFPGPGGEALRDVPHRALAALHEHDAQVAAEHGPDAVWALVSHGDVIKAVLAQLLGVHLDLFQRIAVGPASVSAVRPGPGRPTVLALNRQGPGLGWLGAQGPGAAHGRATVGGGDVPGAG